MIFKTSSGAEVEWTQDPHTGALIRKSTTSFSDQFFEEIKILQQLSESKGRIGDIMHVCRIPGPIMRQWAAEGFDPFADNEDDNDALMERLREMVKRLKQSNMENFIIDKKSF